MRHELTDENWEMMKTIRLALLALLALPIGRLAAATPPAASTKTSAAAHAPLQGYMFLMLYSDSTVVRLELAVPDVVRALSLSWDPKAHPTREQVRRASPPSARTPTRASPLGDRAERITPTFRDFDFRQTESGDFLLLQYVIPKALGARVPITMTPFFEFNEPTRRNLVVVQHNWKGGDVRRTT